MAAQRHEVPVVAVLLPGEEARGRPSVESLRAGLREAGQVEGRTLVLEARFAAADAARFHGNFRRAGGYVDKVLRGAKPAALAIHRPTRYALILNVATARALGIDVPEAFRLRVDRVVPG